MMQNKIKCFYFKGNYVLKLLKFKFPATMRLMKLNKEGFKAF